MRDLFISYTASDKAWAEWIAFELEQKGWTTTIQAWDMRGNFISAMNAAMQECRRTIGVLSAAALDSPFVQVEWQGALRRDPLGQQDLLLLFRVEDDVMPVGWLAQIGFTDLVGLAQAQALETLLARVQQGRGKPEQPLPFPGERTAPSVAQRPPYPALAEDAARAAKLRAHLRDWRLAWSQRAAALEAAATTARTAQRTLMASQTQLPVDAEAALALAAEVAQALKALPGEELRRAAFHGLPLPAAVLGGSAQAMLVRGSPLKAANAGEYVWENAARVLEAAQALLVFDLDRLPRGYSAGPALAPSTDLLAASPLLLMSMAAEPGLRLVSAAAPSTVLARLMARERDLNVLSAQLSRTGRLDVIGSDDAFVYAWRDSAALPTHELAQSGDFSAAFVAGEAGPETLSGEQSGVLLLDSQGALRAFAGPLPFAQRQPALPALPASRLLISQGDTGAAAEADRTPKTAAWRLLAIHDNGECCSFSDDGAPLRCLPWQAPDFDGYAPELGPMWNSLVGLSHGRLAGLDVALFWRHSAWGASFVFLDPQSLRPLRQPLFVRNSVMHVLSATLAGGRWLVLTAVQHGSGAADPRIAVLDLEAGRGAMPALDLPARGDLEYPLLLQASRQGFELLAVLHDFSDDSDGSAQLLRYEWPTRRVTRLLAARHIKIWPVELAAPA